VKRSVLKKGEEGGFFIYPLEPPKEKKKKNPHPKQRDQKKTPGRTSERERWACNEREGFHLGCRREDASGGGGAVKKGLSTPA